MTSKTDKVRGVLLAALLVMSVFAGVPMAASAQESDPSANVSDGHTIVLGSDITSEDSTASQAITLSNAVGNTEVAIDISEAEDAGFDVTAQAGADNAANLQETGEVSPSNGEITVTTTESPSGDVVIPLQLNNGSTEVSEDSRITYDITHGDSSLSASFKVIDPAVASENYVGPGDDLTAYQGEVLTFDTSTASNDIITIYEADGDNGWDQVDRFSTSPGSLVNYDTSDLDGKYVVTYDDQEPDGDSAQADETALTVSALNLEVEADDINITTADNITATVSSEAFNDDYYAELYEEGADFEDDSPITQVTGQFDGVGDAEVDLGNLSAQDDYGAGDYVIRAVHNDSGVEATSETLNVTAEGDAEVSFESSGTIYQERGDVAEFTVDLENTDEAYVEVGGSSSNFLANFTVEDGSDDDTNVTVEVNTAEADGADNVGEFITVSDTDSIVNPDSVASDYGQLGVYTGDPLTPVGHDDGSTLNDPLAAGSYNLIISTQVDERDAKRILSLNDPSVDSVNTWVYAGDSLPETDEQTELLNNLHQTDTVADGDTVVVEASVSGIYGYLNQSSGVFGTAAPDDGSLDPAHYETNHVYLNLTETNTGPNTVANTVYAREAADRLYFDEENNTVYAAYTTTDDDLSSETAYEAEFFIDEENTVFGDDANASTTFDVEDQTMELTGLNSSDYLELEAGENATVNGETNLAPGTSVSVEVETEGQLFTESVEVSDNGTFSAQFDLSEFDAGTSLNRVYAEGGDTNAEVTDAVLVENVQENPGTTTSDGGEGTSTTTTTTEDTTTTTTEETTTEETTTTEDTTTTSSDGGIPGFGIGVSVVALAGAALLALRRSN